MGHGPLKPVHTMYKNVKKLKPTGETLQGLSHLSMALTNVHSCHFLNDAINFISKCSGKKIYRNGPF